MSQLSTASPVCFILTADRARARPFYIGVLGLSVVHEDDFAVTLALAGQFREVWCQAIAVGVVAGATHGRLGLTGGGIALDSLRSSGRTCDTQGQQQTHD